MINFERTMGWRASVGLLAVIVFVVANLSSIRVAAQDDDERRLWDSEFLKKRQPAKNSNGPRKPAAYRRATPKLVAAATSGASGASGAPGAPAAPAAPGAPAAPAEDKTPGEFIGITVWRLRPAASSDNQDSRLLLQEEDKEKSGNIEWLPERVEADTPFAPGDRVRLSIESPRTGYLYVIDREEYNDGTLSEPYLIYPTLRNRGGNNSVSAGKVIELPENSAFKLTPMRADYRGERLTLLVTSEPIGEITVAPRYQKLDNSLVEQWEKKWSATAERFEMVGGAGKPYTRTEKEAGAGRLLTQEDDLPQTLFRVVASPGAALLISVPLKINK